MRDVITITSKGQVTLPIEMRRELGVTAGGKLAVRYDVKQKQLVVSRPVSFTELRERNASYIKPGTKPLTDVGKLYDQRAPRL